MRPAMIWFGSVFGMAPAVLGAAELAAVVREDGRRIELRLTDAVDLSLEPTVVPLDRSGNLTLEPLLRRKLNAQRAVNNVPQTIVRLATGASLPGFDLRHSACSDAAAKFKLFSQQENPPNTEDFTSAAMAFRDHCVARFDATSASMIVLSAEQQRFVNQEVVARALGVLMVGVTPVCTAMLIADDRILTAAHCLRAKEGALTLLGEKLYACSTDGSQCTAFFARASAPGELLPLKPINNLPNQPLWLPSTDYVTLNLAKEVEGVPKVVKVPASGYSPQFLVGWSGLLEPTSTGSWSALMMYTSADWPCAIYQAWGQTALHSCQTLRGFSGAPLIHRTEDAGAGTPHGTIEITGIQARFSTNQDWADAGKPLPKVAEAARWNVAITSINW